MLPLNDHFEKAQYLGQGSACVVCRPNHVKQGLAVRELLGNDRVGLAKGANAHRARVDLHGVQEAVDLDWVALAPAAKGEFIDVQRHEVDLRLKVEAEADHARPALLVPGVGNLFEVERHQAALFELTGNVAVQSAGEVVLQLAVQQALLSCVQRYEKLRTRRLCMRESAMWMVEFSLKISFGSILRHTATYHVSCNLLDAVKDANSLLGCFVCPILPGVLKPSIVTNQRLAALLYGGKVLSPEI